MLVLHRLVVGTRRGVGSLAEKAGVWYRKMGDPLFREVFANRGVNSVCLRRTLRPCAIACIRAFSQTLPGPRFECAGNDGGCVRQTEISLNPRGKRELVIDHRSFPNSYTPSSIRSVRYSMDSSALYTYLLFRVRMRCVPHRSHVRFHV